MLKRFIPLLAPACLFLAVFGFKLDLVHRYGSDLPRWDALDAEGLALYLPYLEGRLRFADLFAPHNEHRIVWTKLLGLIELRLNGQWDARLQCAVNAALHSLIAAWLFGLARPALDRRTHAPVFALTALLFALPLAWVNPIAGFHSQQYLLLGFSLGAIWLLPFAPVGSPRWWTGVACALAALGTMGSGFFASVIVASLVMLRRWLGRDVASIRTAIPTLTVCGLVIMLGFLARIPAPQHDALRAGSPGDFLSYALHCLQWPAQDWSWLAFVLWAPVALLAWRLFRRREPDAPPFPLVLLGLAAWVLLQIAATAYTRGAGGGMPASRYIDTLAFGVLVNGLALAWLWPRLPSRPWRGLLTLIWIPALAGPAAREASLIYGQLLPENRRHLAACEENVRRYLASGDARHLDTPDIPYPGIAALRDRLAPAAIQSVLPASVRRPLRLSVPASGAPLTALNTMGPARADGPYPTEAPPLAAPEQHNFWYADRPVELENALRLSQPTVLRLLVAGEGDAVMTLVSPTGERVAVPRFFPGTWRRVHVPVSAGPWTIQVQTAADAWFAFTEPVEMARGSYWAWRLARSGYRLWPLACGLAFLICIGAWYCAREEKALG